MTSPFNLFIVDLVEHGIAEEPLSPTSPDRGFRPRAGTGVEAKPEEKQNNSLPTIIKVVIIHISYYYLCKCIMICLLIEKNLFNPSTPRLLILRV